jgi:hypothetical protein
VPLSAGRPSVALGRLPLIGIDIQNQKRVVVDVEFEQFTGCDGRTVATAVDCREQAVRFEVLETERTVSTSLPV